MKRKILTVFILGVLLLIPNSFAKADNTETSKSIIKETFNEDIILHVGRSLAFVKGNETNIDADLNITPIIQNGRTLLPLRFVAESFGCEVKFFAKTGEISIKDKATNILLKIGSKKAISNGEEIILDVAPQSINSKTFVPVRFIGDVLDKKIFYENDLVIISEQKLTFDTSLINLLKEQFNKIGNTMPNLNNRGFVAESNGWIYYFGRNGLKKMKLDGTQKMDLSQDHPSYINIYGDWIYYVNLSDRYMYRIRKDGSERQRLNNDFAYQMAIKGDWIYYTKTLSGLEQWIVRMKLDGSDRKKLIPDQNCSKLYFYGDSIYYLSENQMYKMNLDGTHNTKMNFSKMDCYNIIDGLIYYVSYADTESGYFTISTLDGVNKISFEGVWIDDINVYDGWVYFYLPEDGAKLYKMKLDGTQVTKLTERQGGEPCIVGDYIYYWDQLTVSNSEISRMKFDGTDKQSLE